MPEYLTSPETEPWGPYSKSTADVCTRSCPRTTSDPEVAVSSNIPRRVIVTSSSHGMNFTPLSPRAVTSFKSHGPGRPLTSVTYADMSRCVLPVSSIRNLETLESKNAISYLLPSPAEYGHSYRNRRFPIPALPNRPIRLDLNESRYDHWQERITYKKGTHSIGCVPFIVYQNACAYLSTRSLVVR